MNSVRKYHIIYRNKSTLKKTKTSIFLLRLCSTHSKTHICNWNKNSETNVMFRPYSAPTIGCRSNAHLKNIISIWLQIAASGRSIKQGITGFLKWALNYFGLRWGIRVRAKNKCCRWMEKAVVAQNGTGLGRITHSLSQLGLHRGFLWRYCTVVQE